jgi:flagellar basal-body rod modification protein FlgD
MTVSGVSGTSNPATLSGSGASIAGNFDEFLSLLTTQLQNQNPLDPLDTNQFTQQLVEFSSVEQQLQTNSYLSAMMQASQNQTNTQAVSFIGKTVTTSGTTTDLVNGAAGWTFELPQAARVSITIKDGNGNVVKTDTGTVDSGTSQYTWDGTNNSGTKSPDGPYTISIDARAADGTTLTATTAASGVVTGVDLSGNEPELIVGKSRYRLSTISSVSGS